MYRAPHRSQVVAVALTLSALAAFALSAYGDVSAKAGASVDSSELINYLFLHDYESGPYTVGDEAALTLKIKPSYKVRDFREKSWGLELKLQLQFGYHIIKALEQGFLEKDNLQTVSITPTIEFPIRVKEGWVVTPYQEVSWGTDLQGGDQVYTSKTGVRNGFVVLPPPHRTSVVLDLKYGTVLSGDTASDRDYANGSVKIEAVEPIFKVLWKKHQPTVNPFFKVGYYFNALHFDQGDGSDPIKVNEEYEIGFKFSTEPRIKVLGIGMPKPSISFRWGDGLYALKVKF